MSEISEDFDEETADREDERPVQEATKGIRTFPCSSCAAPLEFDASQAALSCPYCGSLETIPAEQNVQELSYQAYFDQAESAVARECLTSVCNGCGAATTHGLNVVAAECAYCGAPVVLSEKSERRIRPRALLPFSIEEPAARDGFRSWINSRWFAPNALKSRAREGRIQGVYVPYLTYATDTESDYTGKRGEDYWDTQHYTTRVNGKTQHRTRRVRKTRWYSARGTVRVDFDDILILAARSLQRKYYDKLEPWDLANLVDYDDRYLSGFQAESYAVSLPAGFEEAKSEMTAPIQAAVRRDIGGDRQRIYSVDTAHHQVTFKHILLPVWLSSYRYKDRLYHVLINARTGEVQGERPWSTWKITFLVLAVLAVIAVIALLNSAGR